MASLATTDTNDGKPKATQKKGVFKALKFEFQQIKSRWDSEIKLMWNRPPPPWPARVLRIIPQTREAEMYDVDELRIRLIINGPNMEELNVREQFFHTVATRQIRWNGPEGNDL